MRTNQRSRLRLLLTTLAAVAVAVLALPAAGLGGTTGSADDIYTWPGAVVLHVTMSQPGSGWVRSTPYRIDCPNACDRAYSVGSVVVLRATPTSGYTFTGWSGGLCAADQNPCVATVTADTKLVANFSGSYKPQS